MAKILVIDDDRDSRFFLDAFLSEDGHTIECAENGNAIAERIEAFEPQVMVIDWMLTGGRTGIEVAKEACAINPRLRVIFVSGLPPESIEPAASGVPCLAILNKPLDFESMAKSISKLVSEVGLDPRDTRRVGNSFG